MSEENAEALDELEPAESAPAGEETAPTPEQEGTEPADQENAPVEDDAKPEEDKGETAKFIKRLKRQQKRTAQENRQLKQAQREMQQRLDRLEKGDQTPPRPKRDDYDTVEEYEDELLTWHDNRKTAQENEPEPDNTGDEIKAELEDELEDLAPDAVEKVMEGDWLCTPEMTQFIAISDKRAQLAYHLATNPDIAAKIAKMPAILAARELAQVESNLDSVIQPGAKPPPPLTPGKPGGAGTLDEDKMSTDQWVKARREGKI